MSSHSLIDFQLVYSDLLGSNFCFYLLKYKFIFPLFFLHNLIRYRMVGDIFFNTTYIHIYTDSDLLKYELRFLGKDLLKDLTFLNETWTVTLSSPWTDDFYTQHLYTADKTGENFEEESHLLSLFLPHQILPLFLLLFFHLSLPFFFLSLSAPDFSLDYGVNFVPRKLFGFQPNISLVSFPYC